MPPFDILILDFYTKLYIMQLKQSLFFVIGAEEITDFVESSTRFSKLFAHAESGY